MICFSSSICDHLGKAQSLTGDVEQPLLSTALHPSPTTSQTDTTAPKYRFPIYQNFPMHWAQLTGWNISCSHGHGNHSCQICPPWNSLQQSKWGGLLWLLQTTAHPQRGATLPRHRNISHSISCTHSNHPAPPRICHATLSSGTWAKH